MFSKNLAGLFAVTGLLLSGLASAQGISGSEHDFSGDTWDLNTTSKLCLSCHDGTVALDSFGGATGTDFMTGGALLSTDLTNDHPVSIDYNVTDTGLFPVGNTSGLGSTIDSDLLFSGNVECASCHDVHDTAGNDALLRIDNSGSTLCLTCHNK